MVIKHFLFSLIFLVSSFTAFSQIANLSYFLEKAKESTPTLLENQNLIKIGELQNSIIVAQNQAFQVNATSEILIAPFFNNGGRAIDLTSTPNSNAFGYDINVTNGGLYSGQLNVFKKLFNKNQTDNLIFQNNIQNKTIALSSDQISHNLDKNITDAYIMTYLLQLQQDFTLGFLKDMEKKLQVLELLVKRSILMESDYLILQSDIEGKKLELLIIQNSLQLSINQLCGICNIPVGSINQLEVPVLVSDSTSQSGFFFERKFENDSIQLVANQRVFENQYKPTIITYANTGLNAVEIANINRKFGVSAGIRLTVPIYDGQQRKYITQQNMLRGESLRYYRANADLQMENNLKTITQQMDAQENTIALFDNQLKKQESILEIYKGKLVQGQVSIIDYLNVIQNYKINSFTKLQMQANYWLLRSQYNYVNW